MCVCVTVKDFGGSKSRVFVLGPDDGHSVLADIARQLSEEISMQRLSLDSLTVPYVDSVIQGKWYISHPVLHVVWFVVC